MGALRRKLLRDLRRLAGQLAAIALVVACGVSSIVTMRSNYDSLLVSRAEYYRSHRFADLFASARRVPERVARQLAALPGVTVAETRVVTDVVLDVPGLEEPATGRLVSLPDRGPPRLNRLHLRRGRLPTPGRADEVVASEGFVEANRLGLGDRVGAVLEGRWRRLVIVGVALSPEYIYELGPGQIFPDRRRFGVFWMARTPLAAALDLDGAFNDVVLALGRGADTAQVLASVDRALERYGSLGAIGRDRQLSHRFLADELEQHRVTGLVIGYIFLGVAAFLLNLVLLRLVATQREQLGTLKAFGYPEPVIARHVLALALVPIVAGLAAGIPLGAWFGSVVTDVFGRYYRFPELQHVTRPRVMALAAVITLAAGLLGAFRAVRAVLRLQPAESMRPEAPAAFHHGLAERLGLLRGGLALRMIVRQVARRPLKSALTVVGLALATAMLIVGRFFFDAVDAIALLQFREVQRQGATVVFSEPRAPRVAHALRRLPGVTDVEPYRTVAVRLRHGARAERTALLGLPADGRLRRLLDRHGRPHPLPDDGLLLTTRLAEQLAARPGDTLHAEVLEGARRTLALPLRATLDELIGTSAYVDARLLHRLLREDATASGALLGVTQGGEPALGATLKRAPAVAGLTVAATLRRSFEETIAESMGISTAVLTVFAAVIAAAMTYNGLRIALSERSRELASLRVLGFTRGEVAAILLGEYAVIVGAAIPLGFALGTALCALMTVLFTTDLFRMPLVIQPRTFVFAAAVMAATALAAGLAIRRRLDALDLVAVLKTRE